MKIDILTLFPDMFKGPFTESILKRAQEKGLIDVNLINIREFALGKHKTTDDYPFGGGVGMVMKPEPIFSAIDFLTDRDGQIPTKVILLCPQGQLFSQEKAKDLALEEHLVFVCGHYEGIDERIRENLVTEELSIGDFVLTGGELPAMVIVDAVTRLIPGAIGDEVSAIEDSFYNGLLDHPHYTRPREHKGYAVPQVLLSGNHEKIHKWRRQQSIKRTLSRRPDLLSLERLSKEDQKILEMNFEDNNKK